MSWWIAQIGHREQYAIAAAMLRANQDVTLCTDYWLPGLKRARSHEGIPNSLVRHFNLRSLAWETISRLKGLQGWRQIEARNQWFGDTAARTLDIMDSIPSVVFSYSYAARPIFEVAKSKGAKTILGQIDPGIVEFELVRELSAKWGLQPPAEPSSRYWDNWRAECDLADCVMVNSEWSRQGLIRAGLNDQKIRIVPLAVDFEHRKPARIRGPITKEQPLRVLFLGQLLVRKGIMELIEAATGLAGEAVEWIFVGDGPEKIKTRLQALGANVKLVGRVNHTQTPAFYESADVFILPTHSDGFAITQLEAVANSMPLIVSKNCASVVDHGKTGILLDQVSANSIVDAVSQLLENYELINQFSRRIAESQYPFGLSHLSERLKSLESDLGKDSQISHP